VVRVITVSVGLLAAYVHDTISDSQEFANRAVAASSSPVVRQQLTDSVDDLIETVADLNR